MWNSLIPNMILFCSGAAVQETVQCQLVSEFVLVKTVNVLLFSVGNRRPGQNVPGLSSECAVRRHYAAQSRTVNLCDADRLKTYKWRSGAWQITTHPCACPKVFSQCWPNTTFSRCVCHKNPLTRLHAIFSVSCLKHNLRCKAFEDEERSKVTPHSNLYRCTKQTTGGASSSGRASGIRLSKQNGSGSEGIST